ncbi:MAG: serine/threonine protein kinase [Clostridia bacterium]|nr:serine/threonine protein kinase [Clostridia bacterium]
MHRSFKDRQRVILKDGTVLTIVKFLGSGGQGEVYEVATPQARLALKWYFVQTGTDKQKNTIKKLVSTGKPDERYLWPIALAEVHGKKSFGYLMPLRPPQFSNIVDLMKRRIEPSFDAVVTACIQLADSFHKLHEKALCYRDISFGNFFFHGRTGDILICDNDNVTHTAIQDAGVLGTPRFMAPEIVRGDIKPNIQSDLFSLSVLIFYMLMMHHPLEGKQEASIKCFDLPAMTKLYGEQPIFIFDPLNRSNRPLPGYHDNALAFWPIYTEKVRQTFIKTFTQGLRMPSVRPSEKIWRDILIDLKNSIVVCDCGMENFYDIDKLKQGVLNKCWACGSLLKPASRIKIENEVIVLNMGTKLYGHHLNKYEKYKFKHILAEVIPHPIQRDMMGLKNLSRQTWNIKTKTGKSYAIDFGKSFTIEDGTVVDFGETSGQIRKG